MYIKGEQSMAHTIEDLIRKFGSGCGLATCQDISIKGNYLYSGEQVIAIRVNNSNSVVISLEGYEDSTKIKKRVNNVKKNCLVIHEVETEEELLKYPQYNRR